MKLTEKKSMSSKTYDVKKISGEKNPSAPSADKSSQSGSALIIVLGITAFTSLLILSIVSISQTSNLSVMTANDRGYATYYAESALSRALWLLAADKRSFSNRSLGELDYSALGDGTDRFLADGVKHEIYCGDDAFAMVSITDMASGIDVSGLNPVKDLSGNKKNTGDDAQKFDGYNAFLNALQDYIDADSFVCLNGGLEKSDYESMGLQPLPRNSKLQFREEMALIPVAKDFFKPDCYGRLSDIRIIPPTGLQQLPSSGKSFFFPVSCEKLMADCNLTLEEAQQTLAAKEQWNTKRIRISDLLEPDVLGKLKQKYSFSESGFYTFTVYAPAGENMAGRILISSLKVDKNISSEENIQFYERAFFQ